MKIQRDGNCDGELFRGNSAADFPVVDTGTTPTGDTEACCWLRAPVCLALKESFLWCLQ